jgi:hypothetical protein
MRLGDDMNNTISESIVNCEGYFFWQGESAKVNLSASYFEHSSDPVILSFWSDDKDAKRLFQSAMDYPYEISFIGSDVFGRSIYIKGINIIQLQNQKILNASAKFFIEGSDLEINPNDVNNEFQLVLTQVPLLQSELFYSLNYDGTISKQTSRGRQGIRWTTKFGKAQLIDNYSYETSFDSGKVIKRLKEIVINYSFQTTNISTLRELLLQIPYILEEDLSLLSFICRKRIICTEIRFHNYLSMQRVNAKHDKWSGFYKYSKDTSSVNCLINYKKLQRGLFNSLLNNYINSPYKDILSKSLPHIISSYEDGYLEAHIASAFFALEGLVNAVGEMKGINQIQPNNEFKRFSKKLKMEIDHLEIQKNDKDSIKEKLSELNRRSFSEKLIILLKDFNVDTKLIWPPNIDQVAEFHNIVKRRNNLIHKGEIDGNTIPLYDLNRIQKITELWILKLLNCPDEAINKISLYRDAQIDKLL